MNKTGKYIAYQLFGLFTAIALLSACAEGNGPGDIDTPSDKHTLSITLNPATTKAGNGLRTNNYGIGSDVIASESKVYSLAVFVFKHGSKELDGHKIIEREDSVPGYYKEVHEITNIELTAGYRDVYIIANAPKNYFNDVISGDLDDLRAKMEELENQKMHIVDDGTNPDEPIGGETPATGYTNLVMTQSFLNLPLNSGAANHYLGYAGNGYPSGVNTGQPLLDNANNPIKVELVRLVARVAIQKIEFDLPTSLTFGATTTSNFNQYVDTVFLVNAKTQSSYFPEEAGFDGSTAFGQGNTTGYDFLVGKTTFGIASSSSYAEYLYKPIANVPSYNIENNHTPLWFYSFENKDSAASPTALVIGVVFQYLDASSTLKVLKAYYPVIINEIGSNNSADHNYIKRNYQYGINVKIKGLGTLYTDYPGTRSAFTANDMSGILEIEETVGTDLFPWTGNIYK